MIEYKYNPLIYYIGRTSLFKRRFYNHLKADSKNKLQPIQKFDINLTISTLFQIY